MKNAEFNNAVNYSNALINLSSEMIKKRISPNLCGMVLSEVCGSTIEMLTNVVSEIDVDDRTIEVLGDGLEDADYQLPDAVAIEYARRTREVAKLRVRMQKACVREVKAESFDELFGVLERVMFPSEDVVMKDTLAVSEMLLDLYGEWREVDMGEFGRALNVLLAVGKFSTEAVADYLDEDDDECEDEEDGEDLSDRAIDLLAAFEGECESFLERYPDMEGCFDVDEDDEDDEDEDDDDECDDEDDECDGDCDHCDRGGLFDFLRGLFS